MLLIKQIYFVTGYIKSPSPEWLLICELYWNRTSDPYPVKVML